MKINRIHINSFGKLKNRTMEFSDGIHVIQGANESGKSTLHAFFEAMLFGFSRGRGRAAKTDLYARYFPEEGGSTYGGVLEFTQDETMYSVYRNFKRNPSGFTLMDETNGKQLSPDADEYRQILGGLSLPLYRNTVSLKQLEAKTSDELPDLLKCHIVNLRQSGSASLDLKKTKERLHREKRALLSGVAKNAAQEAADLSARIRDEETSISALPDSSELEEKKEEAAILNEELRKNTEERSELLAAIHEQERSLSESLAETNAMHSRSRISAVAGLLFVLAGILMLFTNMKIPAVLLLASGAVLTAASALLHAGAKKRSLTDHGQSELLARRSAEELLTTGILQKQQALKNLERDISSLSRDLYRREECEERKREAEEALEALSPALLKNREIQTECEAIDLALATIEDLSGNVFGSFGKYLTDTASGLICQITGGRYTKLLMDENLELSLEHDHQPVSIQSVSVSTIDQVYLALRLALIDFFWPKESMPLLLDESFAMYDEARITETLSWLAENYPGQIFVFSAQTREEDILAENGIRHQTILL